MNRHVLWSRVMLTIGWTNLVFAAAGTVELCPVTARLVKSTAYPFVAVVSGMYLVNFGFAVLLVISGLALLRKKENAAGLAMKVFIAELVYFFLLIYGPIIIRTRTTEIFASLFGVGTAGITTQFVTLYPVWAAIMLAIAKSRLKPGKIRAS